MFTKLLVPVDGSELSLSVLPVVEKLVAGTDAEVILLAVGHDEPATQARQAPSRPVPIGFGTAQSVLPTGEPSYVESRSQVIDRLADELAAYLEEPRRLLIAAGVRVKRSTGIGVVEDAIIDAARRQEVDAIVMATHGRAGLSRAVHGSVTAAVIESGVAPVLVVCPRAE